MHDLTDAERKKALLVTAIRETYEESGALFGFNESAMKYYVDFDEYRCYFIGCAGIGAKLIDDYHHNRKLLQNNDTYSIYYKETDDLVRIYVKELVNKWDDGGFNDVDGNLVKIHKRALNVLNGGIRRNIIIKALNDASRLVRTVQEDKIVTYVGIA